MNILGKVHRHLSQGLGHLGLFRFRIYFLWLTNLFRYLDRKSASAYTGQ